jgi:hypothetical protein
LDQSVSFLVRAGIADHTAERTGLLSVASSKTAAADKAIFFLTMIETNTMMTVLRL